MTGKLAADAVVKNYEEEALNGPLHPVSGRKRGICISIKVPLRSIIMVTRRVDRFVAIEGGKRMKTFYLKQKVFSFTDKYKVYGEKQNVVYHCEGPPVFLHAPHGPL
ncbi:MAG: hypothetical protein M0C28_18330 [Candidatus Moduliflexus flocculans]|nr:hypothetical protein [Candidatus Moduliflexus flocculans]